MSNDSTEVFPTVTPEIDKALDTWGLICTTAIRGDGRDARLAANKVILDALADARAAGERVVGDQLGMVKHDGKWMYPGG